MDLARNLSGRINVSDSLTAALDSGWTSDDRFAAMTPLFPTA